MRTSSRPVTCLPFTTRTGTTISPVKAIRSSRQCRSLAMLRSSNSTEFCERNSLTLQHSCQVGSVVPLFRVYRTTSLVTPIAGDDTTGHSGKRTLVYYRGVNGGPAERFGDPGGPDARRGRASQRVH